MQNKKTVLCGGCFNAVHEGHVCFLQRALSLGDRLVVVIANDAHNEKPYAKPAATRARFVMSLGIADSVMIGSPDGFFSTIQKVKPSIIALGYDQTLPDDVAEKVNELGIKVRRIPKCKDVSTSALLQGGKNSCL